jgi:hypothetical protein
MRLTIALLLLLATMFALSAAEMSYIFKRGETTYIAAGNINIANIGSLTGRFKGDYLWAKIDGREYLIRDAATMDEARRAFVEVEANQELYHALTARMEPLEAKYEALEEQEEELSDSLGDEPENYTEAEKRAMERRIAALEEQMRPLEAQLRELERQEEVLDDKEERLEEAAEKKLQVIIRKAIARGAAEKL